METVPIGVGVEEGITIQISTFDQRILGHIDAKIASQEKVIQQLQVNIQRAKTIRNNLLAKLLEYILANLLNKKGKRCR
ncbi:hypothetical protein J1N35_013836 [Gossypium stocksii]|uniref:Uncharacterized protein n=1 Tax=Gossypium stocksii TaxID=47602 RepID=A0A9D3VTM4_9ROSI|nr:hypothetical protein J1N35_013836 [Gossypium stocksii]